MFDWPFAFVLPLKMCSTPVRSPSNRILNIVLVSGRGSGLICTLEEPTSN